MIKGINKQALLLIIIIPLSITGCRNNIAFTDSTVFTSETWNLNNIAEFRPEISDTSSIHNIFFTIRTGSEYPFRNIWLFVNTVSPSGKSLTDTLRYMLADEKGKWYGKGVGDLKELNLPFRSGVWFPEKGTYTFKIRHGMRSVDLKGVYDLGLRIERAKK
jgi:gliding motility-associated lipoprotein GldH